MVLCPQENPAAPTRFPEVGLPNIFPGVACVNILDSVYKAPS